MRKLFEHLLAGNRPVRWWVSRALAFSGLGRFVTIDRGLFRIGLFPTTLSLRAWDNPHSDREDEAFLRSHVKPGDLIIDVGANVGLVTLAAAALSGHTGKVIAFEPHPAVFRYLRRNVRLNRFGNVKVVWAAVGSVAGQAHVSNSRNDAANTVSKTGIAVPVIRIDDALQDNAAIALLKIDVEGYEKFVLEGARQTLPRVQSIYFEVCDAHFRNYGYATRELLEILREHNYEIFRVGGDGTRTLISGDFRSPNAMNLLAVRRG